MPSSTINNIITLDIIFENDEMMVINKPSGVVVNISETSPTGTIQNILKENYDFTKVDHHDVETDGIEEEFIQRSGIVHRLDKDTSGALLIAKTAETFKYLKTQFQNREVKKEYMALLLGELEDLKIKVDAPIGRNPDNRMKMAVVDGGRRAETTFELEKVVELNDQRFTLVRCYPKTGRTHQIRVHSAAMKHPIVVDPIYMTKKQYEKYEIEFKRLMLHAWRVGIKSPNNQKEQVFEAPLPEMLEEIYSKPY